MVLQQSGGSFQDVRMVSYTFQLLRTLQTGGKVVTLVAQAGFGLNTTDTYTFSFVLWSEAPDTFYVDFEDPANGYNRFGTSTNAYSTGLSWTSFG